MRHLVRKIGCFGSQNAQLAVNKNKNAVRFESQNLGWDFEELQYHSKAFAKGLHALKFTEGDNLLLLTPRSQQAEAYVSKLGSSYINANLVQSQARTVDHLAEEISSKSIKALIFEPTLSLGDQLLIDSLYKLMPQLRGHVQGSELRVNKFNSLRFLFQTNFYTQPGTFKYRSIFNYSTDEATPIPTANHQPIALPPSNYPLLITQPAHDLAFQAGILNSVQSGRFIICAEPHQVAKINDIYEGNLDVIMTEELEVKNNGRVFVEKGSGLSGAGNRVEL